MPVRYSLRTLQVGTNVRRGLETIETKPSPGTRNVTGQAVREALSTTSTKCISCPPGQEFGLPHEPRHYVSETLDVQRPHVTRNVVEQDRVSATFITRSYATCRTNLLRRARPSDIFGRRVTPAAVPCVPAEGRQYPIIVQGPPPKSLVQSRSECRASVYERDLLQNAFFPRRAEDQWRIDSRRRRERQKTIFFKTNSVDSTDNEEKKNNGLFSDFNTSKRSISLILF